MRSAIRALARSNYRTTSIADIAREAGITEPAVYRYFKTKKALFLAILEDVGQGVVELWSSLREKASSPIEALALISSDYYERALTRRGELKVLFQALAEVDDPDIRQALRNQFQAYVDLFAELIAQAQEQGIMRKDFDARTAAWSFLSVGFTLNLVGLLRMDDEVSRQRLGLIQELLVRSLLDPHSPSRGRSEEHLSNLMGRNR